MKVEHLIHHMAESWLKAAVILLIGLIVAIVFRKSSPEFRHRVWTPLFGVILISPLLLWATPRWGLIPSFASSPSLPVEVVEFKQAEYEFIAPAQMLDTEPLKQTGTAFFDWKSIAFFLWLAGVIVLSARLLVGLIRLQQFKSQAIAVPAGMEKATSRYAKETGIQRSVRLVISPRIHSPFAWDFGIPTIALPLASLNWNEEEREMILRHELVHLKRHDSVNAMLATLVTALHWFNPLAWKAARRVSELQEEICDKIVLTSGCDPTKYASLLFHQAQSKTAPYPFSATAVAKPGTLEKRVTMILKNKSRHLSSPMTADSESRKLLPSLATICLIAISALVIFLGFSPRPVIAEEKDPANKQIHITSKFVEHADPTDLPPLMETVNSIILPHVEFAKTPLKDALAFLNQRSRELGPKNAEGEIKGVNIISDTTAAPQLDDAVLTLKLKNVSLAQIFKVIAQQLDLEIAVESHAVVFSPRQAGSPHAHSVLGANEEEKKLVEEKLKRIVIPKIEFQDTKLEDVIAFLAQRSVELDTETSDPAAKGVNIAFAHGTLNTDTQITLRLEDIPLSEAVKYTVALAQLSYRVEAYAVVIFDPKNEPVAVKVERTFTEPPAKE